MPEQLLNGPDIITILQQVGRKRMTKRVTCCRLGNSDFESRFSKRSLQNGLMKMMSTFFSRYTIYVVTGCREYPLPSPFPADEIAVPTVPAVQIVPVVIEQNLSSSQYSF